MPIALIAFIAAVIAAGLGIGLWLQKKLGASARTAKSPSPFRD